MTPSTPVPLVTSTEIADEIASRANDRGTIDQYPARVLMEQFCNRYEAARAKDSEVMEAMLRAGHRMKQLLINLNIDWPEELEDERSEATKQWVDAITDALLSDLRELLNK